MNNPTVYFVKAIRSDKTLEGYYVLYRGTAHKDSDEVVHLAFPRRCFGDAMVGQTLDMVTGHDRAGVSGFDGLAFRGDTYIVPDADPEEAAPMRGRLKDRPLVRDAILAALAEIRRSDAA